MPLIFTTPYRVPTLPPNTFTLFFEDVNIEMSANIEGGAFVLAGYPDASQVDIDMSANTEGGVFTLGDYPDAPLVEIEMTTTNFGSPL